MPAPVDDETPSAIDTAYQEGKGHYLADELSAAESNTPSAVDTPSDTSPKTNESAGIDNWKTTVSSKKESAQPKLQKAIGFAKKRGGIIGIISLFGIGGGLFAGVLGPASMLINVTENFSITNDSSSTALERRFAKIFGRMAGTSDVDTLCRGGTKIACKMGRLSNKSLKQLSRRGVVALGDDGKPIDFKNGKYPAKKPRRLRLSGWVKTGKGQ